MGRFFGTREPCPHCGRKVKKPENSDEYLCRRCGLPGPWASSEQIGEWDWAEAERKQQEQQRAEARNRYSDLLSALATGTSVDTSALPVLASRAGFSAAELAQTNTAAFATYLERAVGDDLLTPEEESHASRLVEVLGIDLHALQRENPDLARHALIAEANGGFLPQVPSSRLLQKKGETVHLEVQATLLKDVTVRQSQGGYGGFSFPIGKTGIRYKVGGYRGHSVEVGTKRIPADAGLLVISSHRAVFLGGKKTLDLPYTKLVSLTLFTDGVQFHQSNRQGAPVFVTSMPDVVSAFVHAAAQRSDAR
jgi:transcription initiation factor TFIIIB Brf1 subunit/transcription initiation factor TFIIB